MDAEELDSLYTCVVMGLCSTEMAIPTEKNLGWPGKLILFLTSAYTSRKIQGNPSNQDTLDKTECFH